MPRLDAGRLKLGGAQDLPAQRQPGRCRARVQLVGGSPKVPPQPALDSQELREVGVDARLAIPELRYRAFPGQDLPAQRLVPANVDQQRADGPQVLQAAELILGELDPAAVL